MRACACARAAAYGDMVRVLELQESSYKLVHIVLCDADCGL